MSRIVKVTMVMTVSAIIDLPVLDPPVAKILKYDKKQLSDNLAWSQLVSFSASM